MANQRQVIGLIQDKLARFEARLANIGSDLRAIRGLLEDRKSERAEFAQIIAGLKARGTITQADVERLEEAGANAERDEGPCRVRSSAGAYLLRASVCGAVRWTGDRGEGAIWGRRSAEAVAEGMRILTSMIIEVEPCDDGSKAVVVRDPLSPHNTLSDSTAKQIHHLLKTLQCIAEISPYRNGLTIAQLRSMLNRASVDARKAIEEFNLFVGKEVGRA